MTTTSNPVVPGWHLLPPIACKDLLWPPARKPGTAAYVTESSGEYISTSTAARVPPFRPGKCLVDGEVRAYRSRPRLSGDELQCIKRRIEQALGAYEVFHYAEKSAGWARYSFPEYGDGGSREERQLGVIAKSDGEVTMILEAAMEETTKAKLLRAVISEAPHQAYTVFVGVSLGFSALRAALHTKLAYLTTPYLPRKHGGYLGFGSCAAGEVFDHMLVMNISALSLADARRKGDDLAEEVLAVFAFLLDHPLALHEGGAGVEVAERGDGGSVPLKERLEDLTASERRLNATKRLAAAQELRTYIEPRSDVAGQDFYAQICKLNKEDRKKVIGWMQAYNYALLADRPEPGFGRYKDLNVSVLLWVTIVEASMPSAESKRCSACNGAAASIEARVKKHAASLKKWAGKSEKEAEEAGKDITELRRVRHTLAHTAQRAIPVGRTGQELSSFFLSSEEYMSLTAAKAAREFARLAIREFVARSNPV